MSLKALDASRSALPTDWSALLMGGVAAGVSAYLCIHFFLKLLERVGLMPFVIYRLALGIILLVYFA